MSKQKSILLSDKAIEVIENYMKCYNKNKEGKEKVKFNKAINNIIEAHEKTMTSKQVLKTLTNIENILNEYIIK